jgi:hypothetical protein
MIAASFGREETHMKRHVRKWMFAGLVALAAAPALAGCVAEIGPAHYHGPGWHHDRDWR